jgi:putative FmdB family regulatory protein
MPTYEYKCNGCKDEFTLIMSITEHEKSEVSCPRCQSKEVKQQISPFTARTSRKS